MIKVLRFRRERKAGIAVDAVAVVRTMIPLRLSAVFDSSMLERRNGSMFDLLRFSREGNGDTTRGISRTETKMTVLWNYNDYPCVHMRLTQRERLRSAL